jgi:hypothetical protein
LPPLSNRYQTTSHCVQSKRKKAHISR